MSRVRRRGNVAASAWACMDERPLRGGLAALVCASSLSVLLSACSSGPSPGGVSGEPGSPPTAEAPPSSASAEPLPADVPGAASATPPETGGAAEGEGADGVSGEESTAAESEPSYTGFPETFKLMLGGGIVTNSSTTLALGGRILQAQFDWENTFGGDTSSYFYRGDAKYRFSPYHSLTLSAYGVVRSGQRVLLEEIEIGDEVVPIGADLSTELSIYLTRLYYTYSFYRSRKVELGLTGGFYFGYVGIDASASAEAGSQIVLIDEGQAILVPVPTIGFMLRYNIIDRLAVFGGFDWFYFDAFDWKGSLIEFYFGLEFRLFDNVAIGAMIDRLDISVDGTFSSSGTVEIENDWNILGA